MTTNYKWELQDLNTIFGYSPSMPLVINIKDGRTWIPYPMFKSTGPCLFSTPWSIYCQKTGTPFTIYISRPVVLDEVNAKITIDGKESTILDSSLDGFTTQYEQEGSCAGKIAYSKEIFTYKKIDNSNIDYDKYLWFDTETEMIKTVIGMMRDYFGNEFDANPYLAPDIILDYPIFNFDRIEEIMLMDARD